MSQTSYLVSCEILCGEGSDGALEGMEAAMVIIGVNASSEDEAIEKIEADFDDEGYALVDVEWISTVADMEWEDADSQAEGNDIVARLAQEPGEVIYGSLYDVPEEDISEAA